MDGCDLIRFSIFPHLAQPCLYPGLLIRSIESVEAGSANDIILPDPLPGNLVLDPETRVIEIMT